MLEEICKSSKCKKHQVAAIIRNEYGHILGLGVNTPILGNEICCRRSNCETGSCLQECNAVHAEVIAILDMIKKGSYKFIGATIYITDAPCVNCARIIAASGIKKVIYYNDYYQKGSKDYLEVIKIFKRYNVKFIKKRGKAS